MDIYESFRGKSIFFTGVTGFVGKVFLWKLIKEFPDLDNVVVLIRTKKGQKPLDRFAKEVMSSPCWEPLIKELGDAEFKRRTSKIVAVSGDVMLDRLGMSEADYEMIAAKVHFIVHMAATVNFDERLDISTKMNVLGAVRMLALAQRSPKLQAFVHVSTCYVNYQRHGRQVVRETIYPLPFDAEDMCKFILAQDPAVIPLASERMMKQYGFPNTYTFTKSMAEQILERRKGNVPLAILRPAIIGCSLREPMPGWVDALTAAGGLYLTGGLGILRELYCNPSNISDLIPVDYVVNTAIKLLHRVHTCNAALKDGLKAPTQSGLPSAPSATAVAVGGKASALPAIAAASAASQSATTTGSSTLNNGISSAGSGDSDGNAPLPLVYHSSTSSSLNVMRWETASVAVHQYWNANPHPKAIGPCDVALIDNYYRYRLRVLTHRTIPIAVMKLAASMPVVGSPSKKKLVERLERAVWRSQDLQRQFNPFMNNQWCFDSTNTMSLDEFVKPEQAKAFACDPYDINWHAYTIAYSYGMMKYIMKSADGRSQPLMPESGTDIFLKSTL